jgi:hypothetical protein
MACVDELEAAEFGDVRLTKRLEKIAADLETNPKASFPVAADGPAALEATYRFLGNEAVTPERILAPHLAMTVERAAAAGTVLVAHDSTECRFSGDREDLGRLGTDDANGFFAHVALALTADETREPLGVLGMKPMFRGASKVPRRDAGESELKRWWEMVLAVEQQVAGRANAIHLMDCEADAYWLFARLMEARHRFVIRLRWDRRINTAQPGAYRLSEKLAMAEHLVTREVSLARRLPQQSTNDRKAHPPRNARLATLSISGVRVTIPRPQRGAGAETITLHVVHVIELQPPTGEAPIEWRLATTEPIDTPADLERVVDAYRARWVIEEYFKALKTGCNFEKRQLTSRKTILNALALFVPIAWRLLRLRSVARSDDRRPATDLLTPLQHRILVKHPKLRLPQAATAVDALAVIARLGGHIKSNGPPGWQVLGRGLEKLLVMEQGAAVVLEM